MRKFTQSGHPDGQLLQAADVCFNLKQNSVKLCSRWETENSATRFDEISPFGEKIPSLIYEHYINNYTFFHVKCVLHKQNILHTKSLLNILGNF
jgi:hypothetical protein